MSSIWTVFYTRPSRYNWMLQYYLRAEGLALSWIGTGRLIFSLNYSDADFAAVADRFVAAAKAMREDGWWWHDPALTNKAIKRMVLQGNDRPPPVRARRGQDLTPSVLRVSVAVSLPLRATRAFPSPLRGRGRRAERGWVRGSNPSSNTAGHFPSPSWASRRDLSHGGER